MGHKFSVALNRQITEGESALLARTGRVGAVFAADSLPAGADIPIAKVHFGGPFSSSLSEAIGAALDVAEKGTRSQRPGGVRSANVTSECD